MCREEIERYRRLGAGERIRRVGTFRIFIIFKKSDINLPRLLSFFSNLHWIYDIGTIVKVILKQIKKAHTQIENAHLTHTQYRVHLHTTYLHTHTHRHTHNRRLTSAKQICLYAPGYLHDKIPKILNLFTHTHTHTHVLVTTYARTCCQACRA